MDWREALNIEKGDLLICKHSNARLPILKVEDGRFTTMVRNKTVKRALGQLAKVSSHYVLVKNGDVLKTDIAFFCPIKNKIIIIEKGTQYLGEI